MSSKKVRNLFKFGRTKSQSTTDLSEWSKSDEKLMKAVEANDVKKVSSILSKKTMVPSKLGPRGQSIFHVACALGNPQIVELLLKEIDDVNDLTIQGNTCLQLAAAKGHEQVVRRLLQNQADVDLRDSNDMTALHHACAGHHYGCVHALLQGEADPQSREKGGKTPLFYAAYQGKISICKLLVDKGADVNAGDKMQMTPLMAAAREGKLEACEFLLRRGANPGTLNREGHTALDIAIAAGHHELKQVFAKAPAQASWKVDGSDSASTHIEEMEHETTRKLEPGVTSPSLQDNKVTGFTYEASSALQRPADSVHSLAGSDAETISQSEDGQSMRRASDPSELSRIHKALGSKDTQAYKELEAEHEQLNEDYHTLSIENLRLRDKLEFLQQQMNSRQEQVKGAKAVQPETADEIRSLKNLLEEERVRSKTLENLLTEKTTKEGKVTLDGDGWHDSDDEELFDSQDKNAKGGRKLSDQQMVAMLRSQILTLNQENDQLRNNTQLKENAASQQFNEAHGQEELILSNSELLREVESLRQTVEVLQVEKSELQQAVAMLEDEKASMPSDKLAVLNSAKVMEEVTFDEEGFVEGQDLTKEEFLQAQNEQLKMQCRVLTDELTKLRATFDAILKAGDNLQADYDQLQAQKDQLHDQLARLAAEKEQVVKENEFLLSDGNTLHEDLKKLVQELEKMQEKFRKVCAEKEQQQNAVTIAGKVGEVSRLLEEREKLRNRLLEAEETAGRLTHDQVILLEEVQSLQDRIAELTSERDALSVQMEETEAQHEALSQEYAQLELDFNEVLKEKESLETDTVNSATGLSAESLDLQAVRDEHALALAEREHLELTIQELSRENAVLEEELESLRSKLSVDNGKLDGADQRDIADLEVIVKNLTKENADLEEDLASAQEHIAYLEARVVHSEDIETETLRASVSQLEVTVTELSRENAHLEEELFNVKDRLDQSQKALQSKISLDGMKKSTDDVLIHKLKAEKEELLTEVEQLKESLNKTRINGELWPSSPVNNNKNSAEEIKLQQIVSELEKENSRLLNEVNSFQVQLRSLEEGAGVQGKQANPADLQVGNDDTGLMNSDMNNDKEETDRLKKQILQLQDQLSVLEQSHTDTVNTYRTHLLSAVQGHMDPNVKEALHNIIEMRSMEQFC